MMPQNRLISSLLLAASIAGLTMTTPAAAQSSAPAASESDPFLWLEEVEGERALAWVRQRNAVTLESLQADPRYKQLEGEALAIIRSRDRLTFGGYTQGYVSNFWQDDRHVRGIWREAAFNGWAAGKPRWTTILDIDALAKAEDRNWVYEGSNCLDPYVRTGPCLISLSNGGKDAAVQREFLRGENRFVGAGGFELPEAKSGVAWRDANTLLVGTDWGAGTMTESGYPFVVKALGRGQALSDAKEIFRGDVKDVGVWPGRVDDGTRWRNTITRATTFFTSETWMVNDDLSVTRLDLPPKHGLVGLMGDMALISLQEAWTPRGASAALPQGALVEAPLSQLMAKDGAIDARVIYAPGERESYQGAAIAGDGVYAVISRNVVSQVRKYVRAADGTWSFTLVDLPKNGAASLADIDRRGTDAFFSYQDMLTPPSILRASGAAAPKVVQAQPAKFDASNLTVQQFEATSKDGTKIPYFVVHRKDIKLNGDTPTLLYGYGGFEVSMDPTYGAMRGKLWMEDGGAYILANIRGGGEFGPAWHQAGLKGKRQVIYDDFIAVAEDAVARRITSPRRLGIMGGSNGGLLMGVMLTQRPDLFRAAVVQVPLLDMLRFDKLLAGASWVDEYGDPDVPEERAFLEKISPYQNLTKRADFPIPLFITSTKDDRVHPGHARKFAARMEALGMPFFYYENIDGGHSAAANLVESAKQRALEYAYLDRMLRD